MVLVHIEYTMGVAWEKEQLSTVEEKPPGKSHSLVNSQSIPQRA